MRHQQLHVFRFDRGFVIDNFERFSHVRRRPLGNIVRRELNCNTSKGQFNTAGSTLKMWKSEFKKELLFRLHNVRSSSQKTRVTTAPIDICSIKHKNSECLLDCARILASYLVDICHPRSPQELQ